MPEMKEQIQPRIRRSWIVLCLLVALTGSIWTILVPREHLGSSPSARHSPLDPRPRADSLAAVTHQLPTSATDAQRVVAKASEWRFHIRDAAGAAVLIAQAYGLRTSARFHARVDAIPLSSDSETGTISLSQSQVETFRTICVVAASFCVTHIPIPTAPGDYEIRLEPGYSITLHAACSDMSQPRGRIVIAASALPKGLFLDNDAEPASDPFLPGDNARTAIWSARLNPNGEATVAGLPAGEYSFFLQTPGYATFDGISDFHVSVPGAPLNLRLAPVVGIACKVTGDDVLGWNLSFPPNLPRVPTHLATFAVDLEYRRVLRISGASIVHLLALDSIPSANAPWQLEILARKTGVSTLAIQPGATITPVPLTTLDLADRSECPHATLRVSTVASGTHKQIYARDTLIALHTSGGSSFSFRIPLHEDVQLPIGEYRIRNPSPAPRGTRSQEVVLAADDAKTVLLECGDWKCAVPVSVTLPDGNRPTARVHALLVRAQKLEH